MGQDKLMGRSAFSAKTLMYRRITPLLFLLMISYSNQSYTSQSNYTNEYSAGILCKETTINRMSTDTITIPLILINKGSKQWSSYSLPNPIFISYHLLTSQGNMVKYDNIRTQFKHTVFPNN
jgi:hypothetical protein